MVAARKQFCALCGKVFRAHSTAQRYASTAATFKFSDLEVRLAKPSQLKPKPDANKLQFGKLFTDHMLEIEWSSKEGWSKPLISPVHNFSMHPASKVLHYSLELFEGLKAFRGVDDKIRVFRANKNMERMLTTADRSCLPMFDGEELIKCMHRLIEIDQEWVPHSLSSSLYIRPSLIGTEPTLGIASSDRAILFVLLGPVGPYFPTGLKPVSLLADPRYVRAWPGGSGDKKMGSNYAPTIKIQKIAEQQGLQQVLWLYGDDHQLTEVGTMNIMVFIINENGEKELITPPLDGLILPGVTRLSLLELARSWREFKVTERKITMNEILKLLDDKRLIEIFGAGTACVVCPVSSIYYQGEHLQIPTVEHEAPLYKRFLEELNDIQYGRKKPHPWAVEIC